MVLSYRRAAVAGLLLTLAAATLSAAPVPKQIDEPVTERKIFLPTRAYQPRAGKVNGVAVSDVAGMMGREGRSSQADALGFSSDGGSYNWMYVPMEDMPQITNLWVRIGEKGDDSMQFPKLGMATPKRIAPWGVTNPYTLVEVEVNNGKAAPADEAFVASSIKVVEESKEFPIKLNDCVAKAKALYKDYQKEQGKKFDDAMAKAMKDALGEKKATGPRENAELMHITWMTREKRLVVTFQTTITDGAYQTGGGGGVNLDDVDRVPEALPARGGANRPPPIGPEGVRWGTQFGIEFGRSYEFNVDGAPLGTKTLTAEGFTKELPPPPAPNFRDPPALPVLPPKKEK